MRNQKGFTLIELIVVIAIIAIVTGILMPVYYSMRPKFSLYGAARQLQGDLKWAKMQAIMKNNEFKVFFFKQDCNIQDHDGFGTDTHIYQILDDDGDGVGGVAGDGIQNGDEIVVTKHIQTNYYEVTGTSDGDPVFTSRGTLENLANVTITLNHPSVTNPKVIEANTVGRIRIN